jgi:hypothetical protein
VIERDEGSRRLARLKEDERVSARCGTGRLQAVANFTFNDGTHLGGTFLRPCSVRK